MPDPVRPSWRCGEHGCWASEGWHRVPGARDATDLDAALDRLHAHYAVAHPELEDEGVSPDARLCAA